MPVGGMSDDIAKLCASSNVLQSEGIRIYQPKLKWTLKREKYGIEKYEFGEPNLSVPTKVIMLVGSTGSGKTTLINVILNHIFGVKYNDPFRFKLITEPNSGNQAHSQTCKIISYTIHHQVWFTVPYTLTIIDTPGVGDTSGIERDMQITTRLHKFISTQGIGGIDHIDAVGFVIQSSLCRLTPTQTFIFDQILSLFGKDIEENIFLMFTFSDCQKPQALSATKAAHMPSDNFFKFNNSDVFAASEDEDESDISNYYWNMGKKSFQKFLQDLHLTKTNSLSLTREVLDKRDGLRTNLSEIQAKIQAKLITSEKLEKAMLSLHQYQSEIELFKDYEYEVQVPEIKTVPFHPGGLLGRLLRPSTISHTVYRTEKRINSNMMDRHVDALLKMRDVQNSIEIICQDVETHEEKVLRKTEEVRKSIKRLAEIALKPNPLSSVKYIDTLMEAEKAQAKPGYDTRVQQLMKLRNEAEKMQQICKQWL